jgi:hypothetical protein
VDKKCLKVVPTDRSRDQSFAYETTTKGEKIAKANLREMISGNRFRSNSVTHDLTLVDIRNILRSTNVVKEYYTENQMQTYRDFRTEEELRCFQELQLDAVMKIQKGEKAPIYVGLEFESSAKAICRYQDKIRRFYYKSPAFIVFVCEDKALENKIKKVEQNYVKDKSSIIFYLTLEQLLSSRGSVTFTRLDGKCLTLD